MIGPVILEYLIDYYTRFNSSTDVILTILQVGTFFFKKKRSFVQRVSDTFLFFS